MKRSESFLVYGVTGVLVTILAIAIIFGNEAQPANAGTGGDSKVASSGGGGFDGGEFFDDHTAGDDASTSLLDELLGDDSTLIDGPAPTQGLDSRIEDDPIQFTTNRLGGRSGGSIQIPLSRTLGPSRTEQNPSGKRYRIVEVQAGDSTSALIQRWCPGTERAIVAALNETVSLDRLRVKQDLVLPWVDTAILLEALRARTAAAMAEPPAGSRPGTGAADLSRARPGSPGGGAATYTVQKGESLWKIAERKVGAKKATAYIKEIVRTNDSISDASRVREGMKIILP